MWRLSLTQTVVGHARLSRDNAIAEGMSIAAGAVLQFDLYLQPGAKAASPHLHPHQEERFVVRQGRIRLMIAGWTRHLGAGEEAVVPPGTPHAWWNDGAEPAHTVVELRPALQMETSFETFCGLARDGKANPKTGLPANVLQLAVQADTYQQELAFASPRQRAVLGPVLRALAVIGRRRGFKGRYPAYSG